MLDQRRRLGVLYEILFVFIHQHTLMLNAGVPRMDETIPPSKE